MSRAQPRSAVQRPSAASKIVPEDRRLLLCEVLLEEYEAMDQPALDSAAVADIRMTIQKYLNTCAGMDDQQRAKAEIGLNGEMVSRLYKLMAQAQKRQAEEIALKAEAVYEAEYKARHQDLDDTNRAKVVDHAVVSEIYGHSSELHDYHFREHSLIADEKERNEKAHTEALKSLREEVVHDDADPKYGLSLRGTGDGRGKRRAGIDRDTAVRNAAGSLRSALCLSGGGIRSATFNLGILQGLARHGLLDKFDYLSTVSGGGFIGGWLSAWIHRRGLPEVVNQLKEPPKSPLKADPDPIEHLRIYSNYLSPQPGLLSADTWTLVASLLRNLLLNWLVFLPVLLAFLMMPRLWTSVLLRATGEYGIPASLLIGYFTAVWALIFIAWNIPSANDYSHYKPIDKYKASQRVFIAHCLLCLVVSSVALSLFCWLVSKSGEPPIDWPYYVAFAEAVILPPWILCVIKIIYNTILTNRRSRKEEKPSKQSYAKLAGALVLSTILIGVAQAIMGYAVYYAVNRTVVGANADDLVYALVYGIISVPVILTTMALAGSLIAGFTSRFTNDDDQEWWARTGAWIAIVIVAWGLVNLLVLFGPLLLLTLGSTLSRLKQGGLSGLSWGDIGKVLGTITGVVSGFVTLIGGFSAKTPANDKEAQRAGFASKALSVLTALLAPIFLGFIFILISLVSNWLLISPPVQLINQWLTGIGLPLPDGGLPYWHMVLLRDTPFQTLIVVILLTIVLGIIMGRLINTNAFSLQYLWRNRIIRAYLGASHRIRRPDPFTGFDTYDNLHMHELRPQPSGFAPPPREGRPPDDEAHKPQARKLFHILNIALNLTGGKKLQWQDRRAESFSVSPLHAGSYWLGYRRSFRYGASDGISLGAAIAISGAFVSPNMGFMMTSPVVRFLMAFFNVRFGWWLGNPGSAGDETNFLERILNKPLHMLGFEVARPFRLRSPRLSILPYIAEAFGATDDDSPYVYLSDGGHFENLGLYEMVLRRCRFIVVSDASTDPDYSFQSLATAIRQIRVDLGVPIDIPDLSVGLPSQDMKSKYCAIGRIRYSCVDQNPSDQSTSAADYDGVLIFIKPSLIGSEPRDVINYWQGRTGFPQEIITDQWFSEAQFESYRALGSYIIDAICDDQAAADNNKVTFVGFAERVKQHTRLNFRAFQNQISYVAFEEEFKAGLTQAVPHTYKQRVKKFMDNLLD